MFIISFNSGSHFWISVLTPKTDLEMVTSQIVEAGVQVHDSMSIARCDPLESDAELSIRIIYVIT